jgi:putative PIN family toxin of toxin-antitoxin system
VRRLVLDPAVLVSAIIIPAGPPAELLRAARDGQLDLVVSPRLLAELAGVLRREKFRAYLSLDEVSEYVEGLAVLAETVADPGSAPRVSRDPADDYLVALADAAGATAIVSGDADLLAINAPPIPVLTPRELLESLE